VARNESGGPDRGQATIELALALPVVMVLLLAAAQVVLVGRDALLVVQAAREAARAASVATDDPVAAGLAGARTATALDPHRLTARVAVEGDRAVAEISYRSPTEVPFVGALVGDVTVKGRAVMAREPP
jgi:hypothetical protein